MAADLSVTVIGYPGDVGGASTECWHTVKLWRSLGIRVSLIPTWRCTPAWRAKLDVIGAETVILRPGEVDLRDTICVSWCNRQCLRFADKLRKNGCRLVWLPCMIWISDEELRYLVDTDGFDRWVFQSAFQRAAWGSLLDQFDQTTVASVIRGAFDVTEFPFRPLAHRPSDPFVIGRLSRPDPAKFAPQTWTALEQVPNRRAMVMGWVDQVRKKIGNAPEWATVLPPKAMPVPEFLAGCHALCQLAAPAVENWPRVGLEAMAAGVPVVADARGGWGEMIESGVSGCLAWSAGEATSALTQLAGDEARRMKIAEAARARVERLADPAVIGEQWLTLLRGLQ